MNLSPQSAYRALASALQHFNWIEWVIIPLAIALMETQPFAILLMFISPAFTGTIHPWPLEAYTVTFLIVGLHWWALLAYTLVPRFLTAQQGQQFRIVGLVVAYAAALLLHPSFSPNFFSFVITLGLVTWFWKHGLDKARLGLSDENLVPSFRFGFIGLLVFFLFIFLAIDLDETSTYVGLLTALGNALPIFFVSGLIALSFTRIAIIRRDNKRSAVNSTLDPTRSWLVILTVFWLVVVGLALALEIFSFQSFADLFLPLWGLLGVISLFLLEALFFILSPLFRLLALLIQQLHISNSAPPPPPRIPPGQPQPPPQIPLELILLMRFLLIALVVAIFVLIIREILRRLRNRVQHDEGEEEIRESLSIRSVLQTRRQEQEKVKQESATQLEPLAQGSARARYRELLQTVAWSKDSLARRPHETPNEYQARLLAHLKQELAAATDEDTNMVDASILEEVTRAYDEERYGGHSTEQRQTQYSQTWLTHLIERLTRNITPST